VSRRKPRTLPRLQIVFVGEPDPARVDAAIQMVMAGTLRRLAVEATPPADTTKPRRVG